MANQTAQLSDHDFAEVSEIFSGRYDLNIELTKEGTIRMMTPSGNQSSEANAEIIRQLRNWWHIDREGRCFDSNTLFTLPDGSKLGPDAAYVTEERLANVSREELRGFGRVCPSFVIELLSNSDSLADAVGKMRDWIRNGVELGWLIDPYEKRVHMFTGFSQSSTSASEVRGAGPVEGFTLDLTEVWRAYE